jgi:phytoene desaturase
MPFDRPDFSFSTMSRIVVIGAGMGGLVAAARLASLGHKVTVCEKNEGLGGKLGTACEGGFRWDTGPSLLTMRQVFSELFSATGDPIERELTLRPLDPLTRYSFADGSSVDASSDIEKHCARLDDAFGSGRGDDWRALFVRAQRIYEASRGPFLESPLVGVRSLARMAVRSPADIRTIAPGRSLRSLGRQYLRDPRLQIMLERYATYAGSDPRRAPAALAAIAYVEQAFGGWYVEGGMHSLGTAIARRAKEHGARFVFGTEVLAIERAADRVAGVRLADGGILPADIVVANADATEVADRLLPDLKLRPAPPSLSGFVLLLGLRGRTPGLAEHTVIFPEDYDAEFDAVFGGRPAPTPTIYVHAPDDAAARPSADSETWFVLVNAPRHGTATSSADATVNWTTPGLADGYARRLLVLLAQRGLDIRDRIEVMRVRTPADLERETGAPGGAIYGTASHGPRSAFLRPANATKIPGLYLVGGSAHPGGGLPLVALSGRIVAQLIGPA